MLYAPLWASEGFSVEGSPVSWLVRCEGSCWQFLQEQRGVESSGSSLCLVWAGEFIGFLLSTQGQWQSQGSAVLIPHRAHPVMCRDTVSPPRPTGVVAPCLVLRLSNHLPQSQMQDFRKQSTFCSFKKQILIFLFNSDIFWWLWGFPPALSGGWRFHFTLPKGELWLSLTNKMLRLLLLCLSTPASFT